jgi:hypothetical protein
VFEKKSFGGVFSTAIILGGRNYSPILITAFETA